MVMSGEKTGPAALAPTGLRERKKQLTCKAVSDAAIGIFLERGFGKVSVAEVAAAADISKPTLFRYFPAKEDLVLHRYAEHEDEAARVVSARASGESPLAALRRHHLDGLDRRDPVTGLCDTPAVLAFHRLLYGTPSLVARLHAYRGRSEKALARALGNGICGAARGGADRRRPEDPRRGELAADRRRGERRSGVRGRGGGGRERLRPAEDGAGAGQPLTGCPSLTRPPG